MNPAKLTSAVDEERVVHPQKKPVTSEEALSIMYVDRARSGVLLRFNILYWGLKYNELVYDDYYGDFVPSPSWSMVLTKRKHSVIVVILTKERMTMIEGVVVYQIVDDDIRHSVPIIADEVEERRYKIEFLNTSIHDEGNEILKERGCLVLGFGFDTKRLMDSKAELYLEKSDETNSLMVAYEKRFFTDFIIRSNGEEFHVHKAILAARSTYFDENPGQEKNEITTDASSKTIQNVIHYLYSGELPLLTLDELIDVLELSVKLHVTSLVDLCSIYLDDVMTADNVERIRDVAIKTKVPKLLGAVNRICSSTAREFKFLSIR